MRLYVLVSSIVQEFSKLCGDKEQLIMLLDRINSPFVRANATVLQALMRLIPFLAFGDREKMHALVSHFMPYLDFDKSVFLLSVHCVVSLCLCYSKFHAVNISFCLSVDLLTK